jgi:hypothetical protein
MVTLIKNSFLIAIALVLIVIPVSSYAFLTQSSLRTHRRSLGPRGFVGAGVTWADEGFIDRYPVILFDGEGGNERMALTFQIMKGFDLTINPILRITVYSTDAPIAGEEVQWNLDVRYMAEGEDLGKGADETFSFLQSLDDEVGFLAANTRNSTLSFTLDASLMEVSDTIFFMLRRNSAGGSDDYESDIATGETFIVFRGSNGIDL